jgi:hypothetical protein
MEQKQVSYTMLRIDKLKESGQYFVQVPHIIFEMLKDKGKSKGNAYMIYSYLVDKFNSKKSYAFPSQARMMDDLGFSKSAIISATQILEEEGLLKVFRSKESANKNFVNKYVVYFPVASNVLTEEEEELAPEEFIITKTIK